VGAHHAAVPHGSALTEAELRLLPLLTTQLSLREIAEILDVPRDVAMALANSIYAKLGPLGESSPRLRSL
jgi:DNA-binding CsgD family transcriptional regulator